MTTLNDLFSNDGAEWMAHPDRNCAQPGVDPDWWFYQAADIRAKPPATSSHGLAKKLCRGCPVATQCLAWAMEQEEQYGVWGGTTANERAQLRGLRHVCGCGAAFPTVNGLTIHRSVHCPERAA